MTSLVNELQREALDRSVRTADLLRKALVVARKLGREDIQPWLNSELNGYLDTADIPQYRSVIGEIKSYNPYNGIWMPIMFPESLAELHRSLTNRKCAQAVSELEDLLTSERDLLTMPYSAQVSARLTKMIDVVSPPVMVISASKLRGILDTTRTTVLEWALQLEEQGVTGEGFSFSNEEHTAARSVVFNIGSMSHSQIQGGTIGSTQVFEHSEDELHDIRELIKELNASVSKLGLERDIIEELRRDIATLEAQLDSPKPKLTIIHESFRSIRNIVEGAAGSAVTTGMLSRLGSLLGV